MEPLYPSTAANNGYLLVIKGKPEGPFSMAQLKEMKISPMDFVKTVGMDDYKEVHEVAELRQFLGFQQQAFLQYYGSFDQRLLASMLDWFLVAAVCMVTALLISFFINDKITRLSVAFSLLVIIPLAKLIYHIIMESSVKQGTYGKQLLQIKVCDMRGNRITISHAAVRNLAKIVDVLTLFIGYLYSFFNKKQQCLHDVIAGTLVVKGRLV